VLLDNEIGIQIEIAESSAVALLIEWFKSGAKFLKMQAVRTLKIGS